MEHSMMKNFVVLRNLPSNIVEEAFVVLKENEKIPIKKTTKNDKNNINDLKENDKEYIIKEAEMHIANYITDIEKDEKKSETEILKIKYKKSRILNFCLLAITAIIFIKNLI